VYHYRERAGNLEIDLIIERADGAWVVVEVELGTAMIDSAASALTRLAATRVVQPPAALIVATTGSYAHRREDGVWVVPLGSLGP
jgi:Holliday junction resolvase-like predicted endonuclease